MSTFFCLPCSDFSGHMSQFTIATGPVIVSRDGMRVLLHVGESTAKWQFIGGRYDDRMTFRENALIRAAEVVGDDNPITLLDDAHPIILLDTIDLRGYEEKTLLIHYVASITDESHVGTGQWYTLDEVRHLDAKNQTSSSNIRIVTEQVLRGV